LRIAYRDKPHPVAWQDRRREIVGSTRTRAATPATICGTSTEIRVSIGVVEVADDEQRAADEILRDSRTWRCAKPSVRAGPRAVIRMPPISASGS
jgi:hypothetical protein